MTPKTSCSTRWLVASLILSWISGCGGSERVPGPPHVIASSSPVSNDTSGQPDLLQEVSSTRESLETTPSRSPEIVEDTPERTVDHGTDDPRPHPDKNDFIGVWKWNTAGNGIGAAPEIYLLLDQDGTFEHIACHFTNHDRLLEASVFTTPGTWGVSDGRFWANEGNTTLVTATPSNNNLHSAAVSRTPTVLVGPDQKHGTVFLEITNIDSELFSWKEDNYFSLEHKWLRLNDQDARAVRWTHRSRTSNEESLVSDLVGEWEVQRATGWEMQRGTAMGGSSPMGSFGRPDAAVLQDTSFHFHPDGVFTSTSVVFGDARVLNEKDVPAPRGFMPETNVTSGTVVHSGHWDIKGTTLVTFITDSSLASGEKVHHDPPREATMRIHKRMPDRDEVRLLPLLLGIHDEIHLLRAVPPTGNGYSMPGMSSNSPTRSVVTDNSHTAKRPVPPNFQQHVIGVDLGGDTTEISGATLKHLKKLTNLQKLILDRSGITDTGLAHLTGLKTLSELRLRRTNITDEGLKHLRKMPSLKTAHLVDTQITDKGLVHLGQMTGLHDLRLGNTDITDAGLVHLKRLTRLQILGLANTPITDSGLAQLKDLRTLQTLSLTNTKITNAGLVHLKGMTRLTTLGLRRTKVTDAGVNRLQKSLTNCRIYSD